MIIVQKVSLSNQLRIFKNQIALLSYKASLKGMNDKKIENSKYLLKDIEGIIKLVQTFFKLMKFSPLVLILVFISNAILQMQSY